MFVSLTFLKNIIREKLIFKKIRKTFTNFFMNYDQFSPVFSLKIDLILSEITFFSVQYFQTHTAVIK
jgi:hypothetical protein